jgi:ABC-type nitrate/sulfonate/bicarbonate transport system permease component
MIKRSLGILAILALWQAIAMAVASPVVPGVPQIVLALFHVQHLGHHITTSLLNLSLGFGAACLTGIVAGTLIAETRTGALVLTPVIDAMRPIAAMTLFPVLITTLGLGIRAKAFVIFWTAWPAVVLNTVQGLRDIDIQVCEAAMLDGCSRWQLLRFVKGPLAIPMLLTGVRIGLSGGWIAVVSSEMLGSSAGLGYAILAYSQTFRFPEMYAIVLTIAAIGLLMNVALAALQRNVATPSPFLRFNDRATSYSLDTLTVKESPQ